MNLENIWSSELVELQIDSNREGIKKITTKVYLLIKNGWKQKILQSMSV